MKEMRITQQSNISQPEGTPKEDKGYGSWQNSSVCSVLTAF